jgi:hypothetical protein
MDLQTPIVLGIAALATEGFIRPGLARYGAWKKDPHRIQVASRDWRGRYVPDLKIKRIERSAWLLLALVFAFGVYALYLIFNPPFTPIYAPNRPI